MLIIPVLIAMMFLFPYFASVTMSSWEESRRTIALQEAASHLSSLFQQLYSSVNHDTINNGNVSCEIDLPILIENYPYMANATLRATGSNPNSSKVLEITLNCIGVDCTASAQATFGNNINWRNSTFVSNSISARLVAEKASNTILMYFGS